MAGELGRQGGRHLAREVTASPAIAGGSRGQAMLHAHIIAPDLDL